MSRGARRCVSRSPSGSGSHPGTCRSAAVRAGGPELDAPHGLDFNVSHTRGVALIAHLDRDGARVGVDLEAVDRTLAHDGLARKFLTARERDAIAHLDDDARRRAFLRLWTCKEAMSKATGEGAVARRSTRSASTRGRASPWSKAQACTPRHIGHFIR